MDLINSIFSKTIIGLDIGVSGIKAVELSFGKKTSLAAYNRISLPWDAITPDGVIKNELAITNALKKLFAAKNFSTRQVSVGIFGNSILSKPIHLPQMAEKDIEDQIYWEAEQYIPFNIEECEIDFAVVGNTLQKVEAGTQSMIEVLLVAAKKEYVQSFTNLIESSGLKVVVLDYQAFALGNAFEFNYRAELSQSALGDTHVLIDLGAGYTKLSFLEKENTVFTTKVSASGSGCTQLISERLGESFEQAERVKLKESGSPLVSPIIQDYNAHWVSEIQKSIDVFFGGSAERHLQKIYYTGGASQTPGLIESLSNIYPEQVENLDPVKNLFFPRNGVNRRLIDDLSLLGTAAVGLALRKTGDSK